MVEATQTKQSKQKLLVIAKTSNAAQAQCTEFAKLGFKAKATHIGATKVTSRFQAACVIVEEGDDYDLFADTLIRFQTVPIVTFVGAVEVAAEFSDDKPLLCKKVANLYGLKHLPKTAASRLVSVYKEYLEF